MYEEAAKIAKNSQLGQGVRRQLYNLPKRDRLGRISFLVHNTLKKKTEIDDLIEKTGLSSKLLTDNDVWLARVLVAEVVLGSKSFPCTDKISKIVYKYKNQLRKLGSGIKKEHHPVIPRYVRINLLKTNMEETEKYLKEAGFTKLPLNENPENDFFSVIDELKKNEYIFDKHVPALLVFNPKVKLHGLEWVKRGFLILQDKSSCMVAPLLAPHPGSCTLDMCAAPGYKTSHVATYLQDNGTIISVDRCRERYKSLANLKESLELNNVICLNQDAFDNNLPVPLDQIDYILLDPPCSGSGIIKNYDYKSTPDVSPKRLRSLHNLQCSLLKRALNDFPSVRRVVYSTCSLTEEENEKVIEEFFPPPNGFQLVDLSSCCGDLLENIDYKSFGKRCIRMKPEHSKTNGFFIAVFERSNPQEFVTDNNEYENESDIKIKEKSNGAENGRKKQKNELCKKEKYMESVVKCEKVNFKKEENDYDCTRRVDNLKSKIKKKKKKRIKRNL